MSAPDPNTTTASAPSTDVAPETAEADVTTGLNDLLADATVFYQKVRHYHWNVTGPHFFTLHEEFEALYTFWNDAIDEIAEQVRSRGDRPVHTLADVLDLASLEEDPSTPAAEEMVEVVIADLAALDEQVQQLAERAEEADDADGAATVLEDLSEQIKEDRWMLRAWLNDL
ncbi:Dps family protein [Salinibacter ruber]|uniref:Dps family protein n=1 Tax=Salinibacter ruber TaxID=146919 RepID=UPI0021689FC1|nr:DNA starvation/stationary phase protection protein [Salinibacter ruber]MCS4196734.1 starvation-inducible DNA-binding protein [Salinibacter ruber]